MVTRHSMTLDDARNAFDVFADIRTLFAGDREVNDRQDWLSQLRSIHMSVIPENNPRFLKPSYAFGDGWRGEADATPKLAETKTSIALQMREN